MITMTTNFACALLVAIFSLLTMSKRKREVDMRIEIISLVTFWTWCAIGYHFLQIYLKSKGVTMEFRITVLLEIVLLMRNVVGLVISVISPVIKSSERRSIPYGETRECVGTVEMALSTELPFMHFASYIEAVDGEKGKNTITLYTQIKLYEDKAEDEADQNEVQEMAESILKDYIRAGSPFRVPDITDEARRNIEKRFENRHARPLDKHLFNEAYGTVINRLQDYFIAFQGSKMYSTLCEELRKNEIIYERLVNSDLI